MNKSKEVLQEIIHSGSLPTLSRVASKLMQITGHDESSLGEVTALISQDVSLSTKLLRVVNSSFYGLPHEVGTIHQAVTILGTKALRSLAFSFSFLNIERPGHGQGFDYERFWERSLATAVASRLIMGRVSDQNAEEVFTASLLLDIGKLLFAGAYGEQYDRLLKEAAGSELRLMELETEHIGVHHAEIGFEAAQHWNFPLSLAHPILHHHAPDNAQAKALAIHTTIRVVHLASLVSGIMYSGKPIDYHRPFQQKARSMFKLSTIVTDEILDKVHIEMDKAAGYFGLKIEGAPRIHELLQMANFELSQLNLSYEQINRELVQAKMRMQKLTDELEEKNRYLEGIANLDGLTEIHNHRYFQEFLSREINRATRSKGVLSLVLGDVDKFKSFNDRYGHQAGDEALRQVAQLCRGMIREYDLVARYGGEEFVVVLPDTEQGDAMNIAEKLRTAIEETPFTIDGRTLSLTMSFGISTFDPKGMKKCELIERADKALYCAKNKGRNRVEEYIGKTSWFGLS